MIREYHIGISKEVFLDLVQRFGLQCFLKPYQFESKEQAMEAVRNDPRKTYVIGKCDNQNDNGCQGHEKET